MSYFKKRKIFDKYFEVDGFMKQAFDNIKDELFKSCCKSYNDLKNNEISFDTFCQVLKGEVVKAWYGTFANNLKEGKHD